VADDKIRVGIVLGSDSDFQVMQEAVRVLQEFEVGWEVVVASAHRSPQRAAEYALNAEERGIEVIIAGAGMAAHLPGVLASYTCLPVIGVPLQGSALGGVDALYSIVQMPPGVPVATVAINGARNAALLAVRGPDPELERRAFAKEVSGIQGEADSKCSGKIEESSRTSGFLVMKTGDE